MTDTLAFKISAQDDASDVVARVGKVSTETATKVETAQLKVEKSTVAAAAAVQRYGAASLEARTAANGLVKAQLALGQANQKAKQESAGLDAAIRKTGAAADETKGKVSKLGGSVKEALGAGAGAAVGAGLAAGVARSLDIGAARGKLNAQLGLTGKDAERYGKIAGQVYGAAYGDSLENVNDALRQSAQQGLIPPGATNDQIKSITENLLVLSSTFDQDLGGSAKAVSNLLRTGLAKNATEAFDIIDTGFQKGLDSSGDFLDTITEYSTQFRKLGISGPQALGLIRQGLQGGARDADIVADSLKEFSIRAVDGSTSTAQGFKALGLSATDMANRIGKGGSSANGALDETLDKLRAIPDPVKRSQIAVQLFGTQAEDLGDALYSLDASTAVDQIGQVAGASKQAGDATTTAATNITKAQRLIEKGATALASGPGIIGTAGAALTLYGANALDAAGSVGQLVTALKGMRSGAKAAETANAALAASELAVADASKTAAGAGVVSGAAGAGKAGKTAAGAAAGAAASRLTLGTVAGRSAGALGGILAGDAIGGYIGKAKVADKSTQQLTRSLSELARTGKLGGDGIELLGGRLTGMDTNINTSSQALANFGKTAGQQLNGGFKNFISNIAHGGAGVGEFKERTKELDAALASMAGSGDVDDAATAFAKLAQAAADQGVPIDKLKEQFPQYEGVLSSVAKQLGVTTDAVTNDTVAMGKNAQAATDLLSARSGKRDLEAAIDGVTSALKENGETLDDGTAKGRANNTALDALATAYTSLGDTQKTNSNLNKTYDALVKAGIGMGDTSTAAEKLAASLLGIPNKEIKLRGDVADLDAKIRTAKDELKDPHLTRPQRTKIRADIADLLAKKKRAQEAINALHGTTVTIGAVIQTITSTGGRKRQGSDDVQRIASGGPVSGPGTGTSDSIPARLSNGEYVVKASAAKRNRGLLDAINSAPGFASGGPVRLGKGYGFDDPTFGTRRAGNAAKSYVVSPQVSGTRRLADLSRQIAKVVSARQTLTTRRPAISRGSSGDGSDVTIHLTLDYGAVVQGLRKVIRTRNGGNVQIALGS